MKETVKMEDAKKMEAMKIDATLYLEESTLSMGSLKN